MTDHKEQARELYERGAPETDITTALDNAHNRGLREGANTCAALGFIEASNALHALADEREAS